MLLFKIFFTVVLPVFILIGLGFLVDRIFDLQVKTMTTLLFYVFSPVMIFNLILRSDLQANDIIGITGFAVLHSAVLFGLSQVLFSIPQLKPKRTILTAGTVFFNSANYGIPVMLLAFGEQAVGVQAIVVMTQVIFLFTFGVALYNAEEVGIWQSLPKLFKIPTLYAVPLSFIARAFDFTLPEVIQAPADYLAGGFVGLALLTLGAQLSQSQINKELGEVSAVALARLVISPLLAVGLVQLFNFDPFISAILVLGEGLPVAVNVFILSVEFDQDAGLASRAIFWTTLASAVTIPVMLALIRLM
jgi:predicted permease